MYMYLCFYTPHPQGVDHLSWLGLYKDISPGSASQLSLNKTQTNGRQSASHTNKIFDKFLQMRFVYCGKGVQCTLIRLVIVFSFGELVVRSVS